MSKGKKIGLGIVGAVVALIAIGAVAGGGDKGSTNTSIASSPTGSSPAATAAASPTVGATTTSPSTPAAPTAAISGDGTFLVPSDVKPGTYTAPDAGSGCYWERLKNTNGDLDSILANDNAVGPTVVTILKTDKAFSTNGCGDWLAGTPKISPNASEINDGTWAVGSNILPGTYKTSGGSTCYWARLRSFTGGLDSIIANDNTSGRAVVTIKSTDKGFTSNGCGTWKK